MIKYSLEDKNLIIELNVPELDHHITNEVRDGIDNVLNSRPIKNIIFDFKNIRFMDSSGIGVIIGRYKKIANDGGKVSVINVNARVKKIFDLSGMNKIISIYDTHEQAISSL
ncbi:MAG: anti-sigma F factor antagonist [Romboutsia sp.]|jgi:stage II sporulation protein AA (anti-sigma F factor antagonist)|nr:anti-sigma F factor antagonist [Romboutsia sp.]